MAQEWRIGQNRRVLHELCFSFSNYHEQWNIDEINTSWSHLHTALLEKFSLVIPRSTFAIKPKNPKNNDGIFERVKFVAGKGNYNVAFSFLVEIIHKSFRNYKSR